MPFKPEILKTVIIDNYGSKLPLTQLSNVNNLDNISFQPNNSGLLQLDETINDDDFTLKINDQTVLYVKEFVSKLNILQNLVVEIMDEAPFGCMKDG